jgi:hypothetical protein
MVLMVVAGMIVAGSDGCRCGGGTDGCGGDCGGGHMIMWRCSMYVCLLRHVCALCLYMYIYII